MKKLFVVFFFTFVFLRLSFSQDLDYAHEVLDSVCSPSMHGRGYTNNGVKNAASYISSELKKSGVKPLGNNYLQEFPLAVNSFSGKMLVVIGNDTLNPAVDYLVDPASCSINGVFQICRFDSTNIHNKGDYDSFSKTNLSGKFLVVDTSGFNGRIHKDLIDALIHLNPVKAAGLIEATDKKLTWHMSQTVNKFPIVVIKRELISDSVKSIRMRIENKFLKKYKTNNIAGYIEGKSDSLIVFTAHYDHLGQMGSEVYFPGANDNGSGISMLLNLAKYYASKEKPEYSIAFLFFSGEEVGLLGSFYFAENPLLELKKIRFLFNLDLVGTGEDGIQIVNSTVFKKEYELLVKINEEKQYLKEIRRRGEAANSDHYPFYAKGVKSFFIYTRGGIASYHDPYDRPETLPLTEFEDLFRLLIDFIEIY